MVTGGASGIGPTTVRPAAAEPAGGTIRRGPSPRTVLAVAALGGAVAYIDATIVNIAFPDIARSFPSTSLSALSWVLNAYNVVFAAFLMAGAGIADSLGRRRVFVFGLGLFTAGSLLCAIAPSAGALIAFRVVQALGAAFLVPSALALVLHAFPPAHRRHGVALLSAVGAAAGFGPSLGGLLVTAALAVLDPPDWPGAHRRPGRRGGGGRTGESAGPAHRTPGRPRGGGLLWGGAVLWFVERVGVTPDFAGQWLPGMVLLGIGAGTLFPVLSGTAVASAPGESFATATGMNSVARQVGAALGVAIVIAIIGTPTPTPAIAYTAFRHAWAFGAVCLFVAGLDCLLVGRVQAGRAPGPGDAAPGDAARAVPADTEPWGAVRSPGLRPRRVTAPDRARSAAGRVIVPGAGDPAALRGVRGGVPRPDPAVLGHPSGGPRAARGESTHAPPVRREMAVPRA